MISEADADFAWRYEAIRSRDRRFGGQFVVAVLSTGIYCRPGCPSRTPLSRNVRFYTSAEAARAGGFRACKRCRPDAGADVDDQLAHRALQLISGGAADAGGIRGIAARLDVGERQLRRRLRRTVGSTPLRLARSRRSQTAQALLTGTAMSITEVAFAAGYGSLRQFNDAFRGELGMTPTQARRAGRSQPAGGWVRLRLPLPEPHDLAHLLGFLGTRAIAGVEERTGEGYRRSLRGASGPAIIEIEPGESGVQVGVRVEALPDLAAQVARARRVLDLDADIAAVHEVLGRDPLLRRSIAVAPGIRLPGAADPLEMAVRAVLGQQISVAGARTLAGRLVARLGSELAEPHGGVRRLFPDAAALAGGDLDGLGLTGARVRSVRALGAAVAGGDLDLDGSAALADEVLASLPGFGPWTRACIAMRALADPDAFPAADLGIRRAFERAGLDGNPRSIAAHAQRWRPWRAYAALHLWHSLTLEMTP